MLRKSSSSLPSSSGSEGEDGRGGEEGERSQGHIQQQIKKELASMRSSLTNLQRNLLTALNALNSMELIIAAEEECSAGGAILSRNSPPIAQLHAGPTATTTTTPPGNTTTTPTDYAWEGRKRRRTTLQRGESHRSVRDHTVLGLLPELVLCILAYLYSRSLCQVSLTCTHLKSLADSQPWQELFDQS